MASTQVPPFAQGLDVHSSISISQLDPVYLLKETQVGVSLHAFMP